MTNLAKCKLEMLFEFGRARDEFMNLVVVYENKKISVIPIIDGDNGSACLNLEIELPCSILFEVSNKQIHDTIVDQHNNIVKDCFIKLVSLAIDGFRLNQIFLCQKIHLETEHNGIVASNYFGFNGRVKLDFTKSNVMTQVLHCNML